MEKRKLKDEVEGVLHMLRQRHKDFMWGKLQDLGLQTFSRGSVLYAVYENEGMSQDEICYNLNMDKAFVTRELNALSDKGLLYRSKDPRDHRKNHIFLTEDGRKLGEEIVVFESEWVNMAYNGVSLSDLDSMKRIAERVKANISNA